MVANRCLVVIETIFLRLKNILETNTNPMEMNSGEVESDPDRCNAETSDGSRCRKYPTDGAGEGRCHLHGGASTGPGDTSHLRDNDYAEDNAGGGPPVNNANVATHELYAQPDAYYQRRDESAQALIDAIYEDYHQRYVTRHGQPATGDDAMLFKVAISIHKLLKADEWGATRPETIDSGHPLVDRSEKCTAQGGEYHQYKISAALTAEKRLGGFVRRWLKENDLLGPPGDDMRVRTQAAAEGDPEATANAMPVRADGGVASDGS